MVDRNGKWKNPLPHAAERETTRIYESLSSYLGGVQSWTPALFATTTAPTYAGAVIEGEYHVAGAWCSATGFILAPAAGTTVGAGTYLLALPSPAQIFVTSVRKKIGDFFWFDSSAGALYYGQIHIYTGISAANDRAIMTFGDTAPVVFHDLAAGDGFANNDQLSFFLHYRVQP
jgi:hypothetical protein